MWIFHTIKAFYVHFPYHKSAFFERWKATNLRMKRRSMFTYLHAISTIDFICFDCVCSCFWCVLSIHSLTVYGQTNEQTKNYAIAFDEEVRVRANSIEALLWLHWFDRRSFVLSRSHSHSLKNKAQITAYRAQHRVKFKWPFAEGHSFIQSMDRMEDGWTMEEQFIHFFSLILAWIWCNGFWSPIKFKWNISFGKRFASQTMGEQRTERKSRRLTIYWH